MNSKIRDTNPFYNGRKLKLGSFSINLEHGGAASTIDGTHKAHWPSIKALAKLHDDMEFEAVVPVARWRGFGGATNFAGPGFETYTFAAGVGAQTSTPRWSRPRTCRWCIRSWPPSR